MKNLNFNKIAVLMGGNSPEREISFLSGERVLASLLEMGLDAFAFDPAINDLHDLKKNKVDVCFIALHGGSGEGGTVQSVLNYLEIPYTSSGAFSCMLCLDKYYAKMVCKRTNINLLDDYLIYGEADVAKAFACLGDKIILKPLRGGSSIGVEKFYAQENALNSALDYCKSFYNKNTLVSSKGVASSKGLEILLAEKLIVGRELTCSVYSRSNEINLNLKLEEAKDFVAFPVVEIVAKDSNYDYNNKYFSDDTQYICPAQIDDSIKKQLELFMFEAYGRLACRGFVRGDFILDELTNTIYFLELNTVPGMTSHSLLPMAAAAYGMDFKELCKQALSMATFDKND